MSGRHEVAPSSTSVPKRVLSAAAAVALLGGVGWAVLSHGTGDHAEAAGSGCVTPTPVRVATTADFAPVVDKISRLTARDQQCVTYQVTTAASSVTADQIASASGTPDVWIPDSSLWVERAVQNGTGPTPEVGPDFAISPLVITAPLSAAKALARAGAPSWRNLLGSAVPARMSDPTASTTGLLTLISARSALGTSRAALQAEGAAMIPLSRSAAPDVETLFAQADRGTAGVTVFPASEQQVATYNVAHQAAPLVGVVPTEGTGALDYKWVTFPTKDAKVASAVAALKRALASEEGRRAITGAGFRTSATAAGPQVAGISSAAPKLLPPVGIDQVDVALRAWSAVSTDMRMLAVVDVSGSMKQTAGNQSRIALAQGAATTALTLFPATSQVGLWDFSIGRGGPGQDWKQLVPVAQLDIAHAGVTQRQSLIAAARSLAGQVGGDTGLYDTILAAYLSVKASYDPRRINSVVILTDGKNDDPAGLTLDQLLSRLRAAADPAKPIPVITVGMGPEADQATLSRIARQTGGKAYLAKDPRDITTVFVEALLQRQCRPDCH